MEIPGLGHVTKDAKFDRFCSKPLSVTALGGKLCRIVLKGYEEDKAKEDFHTAVKNFLSIDQSVLKEVEPHIYRYYMECNSNWEPEDEEYLSIESPQDIWNYIIFGDEPIVRRRRFVDRGVYVSLECNCDWEEEHGLQIVFKNGLNINKIGPYDDHLTNSDAYAKNVLEEAIYVAVSDL